MEYDVWWSAPLRLTGSEVIAVGDILVLKSDRTGFVKSTLANRTAHGRRSSGLALIAADVTVPQTDMQQTGMVPKEIAGLGTGAASPIRVSDAGRLERCSPSGADDIAGRCDTDGTAYLSFSILTAAMLVGGGGGSVPTGTGFPHITGGAQDAAARAVDPTVSGDMTVGSNNTVLTSNGSIGVWATVVNANIAAGAGIAVSKLAPGSNGQFLQTTGGVAVWGAGPSGASTTGTGFWHNTSGSLDAAARAVDLATADVTGLLPLSKQAAPTGTGFVTVTSGAWDAAALAFPLSVAKGGTGAATFGTAGILHGSGTSAVTCSLIVDADVSASAAIASSKLAAPGSTTQVMWNNGGTPGADSGFTYSSGVANLSTALTLGSTVATAGDIRLRNTGAINQRNAANTQNLNVVNTDGSDVMSFGDYVNGTWTVLQAQTNLGLLIAGNYSFLWQNGSTAWKSGGPIHGYTGLSSPHGVHGWSGIVVTGSFSIAAADYAMPFHKLTGTPGAFTVTYPAPADDAHTYWQWVWNTTNVTATISTGAGATIALLTNKAQLMSFSTAGVIQIAAAV